MTITINTESLDLEPIMLEILEKIKTEITKE